MSETDRRFMRMALGLGARNEGRVAPNPSVGCVIVKDGEVVGRGWTQVGGRPHAETEALDRAGERARGATLYVTLEPCANWGRTPPCALRLVEAGIRRAVIGCLDPDPRVNGKGIAWLREAGIEIELGCLGEACLEAHLGLYRRIVLGRPMVGLKIAMSADGRIATGNGESRWITSEPAREFGHLLRARHDGIMIGSGTALSDDPQLTCRLPGLEAASPVRIVLDRRGRLPARARLLQDTDRVPTWIVTSRSVARSFRQTAQAAGASLIELDPDDPPATMMRVLADRELTRVLVEGGPVVATALLRARLVDRIYLFTAPLVIGSDGLPALGELAATRLEDAPRFEIIEERALGPDRLTVLRPRQPD